MGASMLTPASAVLGGRADPPRRWYLPVFQLCRTGSAGAPDGAVPRALSDGARQGVVVLWGRELN